MKRVYKTVAVDAGDDGFTVTLDGRPVRSPGRNPMALSNRALADAVAAEWDAQSEAIDPLTMPMMSLAATAIDRVTPQREHVIGSIAAYAESDLLCYRAEEPDDLVRRQFDVWQPLLDWCAETFEAPLEVTTGIMPLRQSESALAAIRAVIAGYDDPPMTALHELTACSGSVVIGLAIAEGRIGAEDGVAAAQLDEAYQLERWGAEEEAVIRLANMRRDMLAAAEFLRLCRAWN